MESGKSEKEMVGWRDRERRKAAEAAMRNTSRGRGVGKPA
jgi:hypothetical protein